MNQKIQFKYIKKLNYNLSIAYNQNIPFKLKNQIEISAKKITEASTQRLKIGLKIALILKLKISQLTI